MAVTAEFPVMLTVLSDAVVLNVFAADQRFANPLSMS
jgi:hypothetical protein